MLTGGQFRSTWPSAAAPSAPPGAAPGAGWAGWSDDDPPPNRFLKRSLSDCAAAGEAKTLHPTANATAADTAILRYSRDGVAVLITSFLPIRNPSPLSHRPLGHRPAGHPPSCPAAL